MWAIFSSQSLPNLKLSTFTLTDGRGVQKKNKTISIFTFPTFPLTISTLLKLFSLFKYILASWIVTSILSHFVSFESFAFVFLFLVVVIPTSKRSSDVFLKQTHPFFPFQMLLSSSFCNYLHLFPFALIFSPYNNSIF